MEKVEPMKARWIQVVSRADLALAKPILQKMSLELLAVVDWGKGEIIL